MVHVHLGAVVLSVVELRITSVGGVQAWSVGMIHSSATEAWRGRVTM